MAQDTNKQDPEVVIEKAINRSEQFLEKYSKVLLISLIVVVVAVCGYFGYKHLYQAPRIEKATAAMYASQHLFEQDSFAQALPGFEMVMDKFSGTPQANVAAHYAGICCLYNGDYQRAVDFFGRYDATEGAAGIVLTAQNLGLTGDAYVQMNDLARGAEFYAKAASSSDNGDTAPYYLKKAGLVNEALGNNDLALEQYSTIRDMYPQSFVARDIDKFIAHVQQLQGK